MRNFDSAAEYRDHNLDAGFAGLSARAGDSMTVKFENASSGSTTNGTECLVDRLHVALHSDQIKEIRDSGVKVFD